MNTTDFFKIMAISVLGGALGAVIAVIAKDFLNKSLVPTDLAEEPIDASEKEHPDETTNLDVGEYSEKLKEENYIQYSLANTDDSIHFITADEVNNNGYETETLNVYTDGTVTDESFSVIDITKALIGCEPDEGFAQSKEKDVFYVQNDLLKINYEVIRVDESYDDLLKRKPYLLDDLL